MKNRTFPILIVLLLLAAGGSASAQDAVSSASPGREPIWTARLLFIAINNGKFEDAFAMFDEKSTVVYLGNSLPKTEIADWLQEEIFDPGVSIDVENQNVDGKTVDITLEWKAPDRPVELRRFIFTQNDQGLIGKLVIESAE